MHFWLVTHNQCATLPPQRIPLKKNAKRCAIMSIQGNSNTILIGHPPENSNRRVSKNLDLDPQRQENGNKTLAHRCCLSYKKGSIVSVFARVIYWCGNSLSFDPTFLITTNFPFSQRSNCRCWIISKTVSTLYSFQHLVTLWSDDMGLKKEENVMSCL